MHILIIFKKSILLSIHYLSRLKHMKKNDSVRRTLPQGLKCTGVKTQHKTKQHSVKLNMVDQNAVQV